MVVGSTREKEEQRERVNLVNRLIEDTFGRGFSGDWFCNGETGWFKDGFERKGELNNIRKKGFGSFEPGEKPYAAIFSEKDGSSMTVFPEYYVSALKYSLLYEKAFGKKVEIKVPGGGRRFTFGVV